MKTARVRSMYWVAALCLLALLASTVQANSFEYENYIFHYNALRTDELPAESTQKAGIQRSRNRGMINLALRQKQLMAAPRRSPRQSPPVRSI